MPLSFQSARLTYRAMRPEDLEELYIVYNDPEVQMSLFTATIGPRAENFKEMIKKWSEVNPLFAIVVNSQTGEFIGQLSLRFEAPAAMRDGELGVVVKRSQWGKGYGTEMVSWIVAHGFKFLNLHRVSLGVFADNERAVKTYKKVYAGHELRPELLIDLLVAGSCRRESSGARGSVMAVGATSFS
jgi:RimJ/RimL family protein N-acetyltransferase